MTNKRTGLIQINLAVFLFGFAGLFGKFIHIHPAAITFGRTFFAGITLFIGLILTRTALSIQSFRDFLTLLLSGFVLAVHWFTFFQSIQVSSVAIGLLSFSSFPLFVTFMEPYFFGERLKVFDVIISVIVVMGLVLVIPAFDFSNHVTQGVFWGVLSGLTFAFLSLLNRMHVGRHQPLAIAFYQLVFATLFSLPAVFFSGASPTSRDILLLLVLGVMCTALAQLLFIGSLRHIKAQLASVIAGLEPVYGIVFAFLLLSEVPSLRTCIGGLLILGAVFAAMVKHMKVAQ
ncbi:MAG: DMT family transporter [Deltaproteobacteria bacterium]|nr:DMT family transporter [Deltaproteobacteria bacterium]